MLVLAVAGAAAATWKWNPAGPLDPHGAVAQAPARPRLVAVEVATAVKKSTPVQIEALGTVTPMASVAIKSRIDSEITGSAFRRRRAGEAGRLLITLDSRAIEAQILQAEGNIARDKAQLEGAERDIRRYTELVAKNATPVTNLDNAKTQAAVYAAALKADEAMLKNLQVQLSYATIRAPISGRISAASVKVGNFVRSADLLPIATIIQTAPVYVSFPVPQIAAAGAARRDRRGLVERRGDHPGRDQARRRPHRDDREHGRSRDRHGQRARHHAERERTAVAGHAGADAI